MRDRKNTKSVKKTNNTKSRNRQAHILVVCAALLATIFAILCALVVVQRQVEVTKAKQEVAALPDTPKLVWSDIKTYTERMQAINSDYVGALRIENTTISYPVARGTDNEKYLDTSFQGDKNLFGSLFMDYRCTTEELPHLIIYGHHALDTIGNSTEFFGGLEDFLDKEYLKTHDKITYIGLDYVSVYQIYDARVTDTDDAAYQLDFSTNEAYTSFLQSIGAPVDTDQIITLSTCYRDGSDNKRIVVQGARESVTPVEEAQMMVGGYE